MISCYAFHFLQPFQTCTMVIGNKNTINQTPGSVWFIVLGPSIWSWFCHGFRHFPFSWIILTTYVRIIILKLLLDFSFDSFPFSSFPTSKYVFILCMFTISPVHFFLLPFLGLLFVNKSCVWFYY